MFPTIARHRLIAPHCPTAFRDARDENIEPSNSGSIIETNCASDRLPRRRTVQTRHPPPWAAFPTHPSRCRAKNDYPPATFPSGRPGMRVSLITIIITARPLRCSVSTHPPAASGLSITGRHPCHGTIPLHNRYQTSRQGINSRAGVNCNSERRTRW